VVFENRLKAGLLLGKACKDVVSGEAIIIGLARGGVVLAKAMAEVLCTPFDCLVVKKITSSVEPELALGALAPDRVYVVNYKRAQLLGVDKSQINTRIDELVDEIKKKQELYRQKNKPLRVKGKTVIIVDDGIATGATMEVAIKWVRKKGARIVYAAAPVISSELVRIIEPEVKKLITLHVSNDFKAVSQFYKQFDQVNDNEVMKLLKTK